MIPKWSRHGTLAGVLLHRSSGTPMCSKCEKAEIEYQREQDPNVKKKELAIRKANADALRLILSAGLSETHEQWIDRWEAARKAEKYRDIVKEK